MDFFSYIWLYDKRWFFGIPAPSPYKLWILPFLINITFVFYNSFLLYYGSNAFCFENYEKWLQGRNVMLMLSTFLIGTMICTSIINKKKQKKKFLNVPFKEVLSNRYEFWVRKKGLKSIFGLLTFATSLINVIWAFYGYNMVKQNDYQVCSLHTNGVIIFQIAFTLLFFVPFMFTLAAFFLIKGGSLLIGWLCPDVLICLKKI